MKLIAWGANNYGQLGLGFFTEQCNCPLEVEFDCKNIEEIHSISGGGGHTIISDNHGRLYGCGLNNCNQLLPASTINISKFTELDFISAKTGSEVICGWECSFLLSPDDYLLVWGSNSHGQLGIGNYRDKKTVTATQLPISRVAQVSSGLRHTAVLLENGNLFVCGQGKKGQLGVIRDAMPLIETDEFVQVTELSNVKSVACGQNHTIALTQDGAIYAWGDNKHGQLGLDPSLYRQASTPQLVTTGISATTKLYAGWTHSVLLKDDGSVFNCGRNSYGQLGNSLTSGNSCWSFDKLQFMRPVRQLAIGSEHNLIVSDDGEVWSWGWNEHGSCGLDHQDNVFTPTKLKFSDKAVLVGSGSAHCFAVLSD